MFAHIDTKYAYVLLLKEQECPVQVHTYFFVWYTIVLYTLVSNIFIDVRSWSVILITQSTYISFQARIIAEWALYHVNEDGSKEDIFRFVIPAYVKPASERPTSVPS